MPLVKPVLYPQVAFDAENVQVFKFNVVGGTQVTANKLTIKNNITFEVVYDATQTTFAFQHSVPAGTLVNGDSYTIQVQTSNLGGVSALSDPILCQCYTTPVFECTNMPTGSLVDGSTFDFNFRYLQIQGEALTSYSVTLFDNNMTQLSTSGIIHPLVLQPPTYFNQQFGGFDDDAFYYISADGITDGGTIITTGKLRFDVNYINPEVFAQLELKNDGCNGWIQIRSNMVSIEGESNPSPPIYIDDKKVDLTGLGHWVRWRSGYSITGDFKLGIWIENATVGGGILAMANAGNVDRIRINCQQGYDYGSTVLQTYYECFVNNGGSQPYYIYSNFIDPPTAEEQVFVCLRRINNYYSLKIVNRGVEA